MISNLGRIVEDGHLQHRSVGVWSCWSCGEAFAGVIKLEREKG